MQNSVDVEFPASWTQEYARAGYAPFQHPACVQAYARAYQTKQVKVVQFPTTGGDLLSAFEVDGNIARCLLQGAPVLTACQLAVGVWIRFLEHAIRTLKVEALFFPLVYADAPGASALMNTPGMLISQRLPSPAIDWRDHGKDQWERVVSRLGKQALRRAQAFARRSLTCRVVSSEDAVTAIGMIELKSWKAQSGQDMFARDQFNFYASLLRGGAVSATLVVDGDQPVAYRLDCLVRSRLYCLKWSYNDAYRSCSPGFYLIARQLVAQYADVELEEIDLFGSPDTLKDVVQTHDKQRCDLGWPQGSIIEAELRQHHEHDLRLRHHYETRQGLRHLYPQVT